MLICIPDTNTLTLKIVYLDTTDILHLNYYVQHIDNKKYYIGYASKLLRLWLFLFSNMHYNILQQYNDVLSHISIYVQSNVVKHCIVAGDLNTEFSRHNSGNTVSLNTFD